MKTKEVKGKEIKRKEGERREASSVRTLSHFLLLLLKRHRVRPVTRRPSGVYAGNLARTARQMILLGNVLVFTSLVYM